MRRSVSRAAIALGCGLAAVLLGGCKAAAYLEEAKRVRTKNPHAAIEYLALCLKEEPANQEALNTADQLGKEIAAEHKAKVEGFERAKKYEEALAQCDRVIATQSFLSTLPGGITIFHDDAERPRLAEKSAEKRYEEGLKLEQQESYKNAAIAFRRALGYVPAYKDAQAHYDAAKAQAVVKLAVLPFQGGTFSDEACQAIHDGIVQRNPEFVEVAMGYAQDAKHVMNGRVQADFRDTDWVAREQSNTTTVSRPLLDENGTEVQKPVLDANGQQVVDAYGNPEYETVYQNVQISASWTVYSRKTSLKLTVSFDIKSTTGSSVTAGTASKSAQDEYTYRSEISGDPDAYNGGSLPDTPRDVKGLDELGAECLPGPCDELAQKIFKFYK